MPSDVPSKRKRHVKNTLYGLFSWLFPILPTMIATPLVVKGLGNEQYGLFVVILGFISYFFTTGIGKVAAKYVAEYRATGETEKISAVISSTIVIGLSVTLAGSAVVIFYSRYIVADILLVPSALQNDAVTALYLGCATIVSVMLSQIFQLVLQGLQRFDRYLLLANLSSFLFSIGSVVLVLNGFGVVGLLCWNLFSTTLVGVLSYFVAKKLLPEFKFSLRIGRDAWVAVTRYAASIIAYQIFGNILLLFERAWIMRKFGPEAVTYYAIPMSLAMYLHLFIGSLILAMFPMINELLDQKDKLITLYQKSTKLVLTLVAFAVLSAVIVGRLFLGLWLSDDFASLSYSLLNIHVLTFGLLAVSVIAWQVAESFRAAVLNAISTFIWMAISIPLMIFLAIEWQTSGVALARLIGVLVFIPLIVYVEKNFLGGIFWRFWGFISLRIALAAILASLAEWSIVSTLGASWLTLILAISAGGALFAACLLLTGFFDDSEKQLIRDLITRPRSE